MTEEEEKELLDRIKKIEKALAKIDRESKVGLEDQLFFGVVVSLALFFLALPFVESTSLLQTVFLFDYTTALNIATTFRNSSVLLLLSSMLLRYYGAIKPHKGARLWSILCLLFSFDLFLFSLLPALTNNISIEMKPIAIPLTYFVLFVIYWVMGKYVEPSIISFYAERGFVHKRYSEPIVSFLFMCLCATIYFTIAIQVTSSFAFRHQLTLVENLTVYIIFYFLFVGLGYSLFIRRFLRRQK